MIVACASPKSDTTQVPQQSNNTRQTAPAPATESTTPTPTPVATPAPDTVSSASSPDAEAIAKLIDEIQKLHPESDAAAVAKLAAEIQQLHNKSVYFDFDDYAIKSEFRKILDKQAADFGNHNGAVVVLEGNADERGSAAYNLALGERRSTSVKKGLVQLGIPVSQIKVVSYGKSKPKLNCHEEQCWQENRRVDFVYK